jgi:hypothetical protein
MSVKLVIRILVVIGAVHAGVASAIPIQWTVGEGGNGHLYEAVVVDGGVSWDDANAAALAAGGYLATATSAAENDFIFSLIDSPEFWAGEPNGNILGPYLGGFQLDGAPEPADGWNWVNGEGEFVYTNWEPREPNNAVDDENRLHYLGIGGVRGSQWNDYVNDGADGLFGVSVVGYVIEVDSVAVTEPAPIAMIALGLLTLGWSRARGRS